eukprot:1051-Heterococcus_DN1.PRE.2
MRAVLMLVRLYRRAEDNDFKSLRLIIQLVADNGCSQHQITAQPHPFQVSVRRSSSGCRSKQRSQIHCYHTPLCCSRALLELQRTAYATAAAASCCTRHCVQCTEGSADSAAVCSDSFQVQRHALSR